MEHIAISQNVKVVTQTLNRISESLPFNFFSAAYEMIGDLQTKN